jgi:hypothetical protein
VLTTGSCGGRLARRIARRTEGGMTRLLEMCVFIISKLFEGVVGVALRNSLKNLRSIAIVCCAC